MGIAPTTRAIQTQYYIHGINDVFSSGLHIGERGHWDFSSLAPPPIIYIQTLLAKGGIMGAL